MRVDLATPAQTESLVDLLCEVNRYYNPAAPAGRDIVRNHVHENLMSAVAPHRLVVATRPDGTVAGLAAVAFVHSFVDPEVERRKHCQLKELFVSERERGQGVGRALVEWIARYALDNGCFRIDWPVKASNARGIRFYERLGATRVKDRLSYRLSGPALAVLADRHEAAPRGR